MKTDIEIAPFRLLALMLHATVFKEILLSDSWLRGTALASGLIDLLVSFYMCLTHYFGENNTN